MEGTCNGTCSAFAFACAGNYELGHVYWTFIALLHMLTYDKEPPISKNNLEGIA